MSDRDDTAEVGRTVAELLYSGETGCWPKSTIFSLRADEVDDSLRCTSVDCECRALLDETSLGSEYDVKDSLVEIDSLDESCRKCRSYRLSLSNLLRCIVNLFNSVPEVVSAGFVFGADIPFNPWLIVPTGIGEREGTESLS